VTVWELSFLPVHAAGQYHSGVLESAADYFVSSYVPTLSALTKARSRFQSIACNDVTGLLVCEASSGSRYLPNVVDEVRAAERCFEAVTARVLNTISAHTRLAQLREMLEAKPAHILHLATHGVQEPNPLQSAFLVEDGRLSIEDIMRLNLPDAVLAFLSACQTAKGDEKQPDQVVHLAASMLFFGFRSVVGTMWCVVFSDKTAYAHAPVDRLMHDEDGPRVARCVYEYLFKSGRLNLDDVPYALDAAVTMLREAGVPAERWALFVHMGG
jgi:CHAT domain-containing protein